MTKPEADLADAFAYLNLKMHSLPFSMKRSIP